jgi:DNA polymerase-3 subunit beta
MVGFDTKEFPIIPKIKGKPIITLPAQIIKNGFLSVVNSSSLLETRPELTGVFTKFTTNNIELAATDSFRLSERIISHKPNNTGSAIIPRNTVLELIRVLSDIDADVNIVLSENQILFSSSDFTIISRLIDGNYPDYKKVIPENFVSKVLLSKEALEKGVRLASLFTSNISDIRISVLESKTEINAKNTDKGELLSSIESKLKNEPFSISLNYNYLLDGIKSINSEKVVLQYTGDGSPLVVKKGDEDKMFTYVIMPLRE